MAAEPMDRPDRIRPGEELDFAALPALVRACGRAARLAIEKGRIDRLTG